MVNKFGMFWIIIIDYYSLRKITGTYILTYLFETFNNRNYEQLKITDFSESSNVFIQLDY